jgi:nucleoside-diphosphate-sugar epimerase
LLRAKKTIGETVNIGSDTEISIGETFNLIKDLMSSNVALIEDENRKRPKNSEVFRLRCDNKKIKKLVGYTPEIDIQNGLKKTINWITKPENLKMYKADMYNV